MPARPDRLARDLVAAAFELHRRRPWREIAGDAVFLVRVPTEELPIAANVMGQMGEEYGLGLARGEGAFRRMAGMHLGDSAWEDFTEGADLLSLTFDPLGTIPEEYRRLARAAGLQPRRERVVPMVLVRRPYENPHPAGRSELRTLLWVVRGVLAAHDAGELKPPAVSRAESRRVLEIEVTGELREPAVTTRLVPWPEDAEALDPPPLVALPADLRDLPRLDERWLVTRMHMSAEVEGDARSVFGVFVATESDGLVLQNGLAMGDELAPVAETLAKAFRGETTKEHRGLPRDIVFDSPRLHASLAPALAGLDVEAVLDADYPPLVELAACLEEASDTFEAAPPEVPETLEDWKAVDKHVAGELLGEILQGAGPPERALKRHFGSVQDGEEALERHESLSVFGSFAEWLAADYRPTRRSKTMIEKRLAKKRLPASQRVLLEARRDALLSIFRVDSRTTGVSIEVEDVLTGERHTVHDASMSACEVDGCYLPLRLLRVQQWCFPSLAGPPLSALHVDGALRALERMGAELTPEGLRRDAHLVGRLWPWFTANERPRFPTQNTDGDPLEPQSATFHLADPAAAQRALDAREDLDFDPGEGLWVWVREGGPAGAGRRTVLGRLAILDDRLLLEVNSLARLARGRKWLETIPGVRFERSTMHAYDGSDRPLDDRLPGPPQPEPSPAELEAIRQALEQHYFSWLDERVPALGDLTPREACKTEDGRRRVERLVRTMPPIGTPHGSIPAPREELSRELGIAGEG